MNTKKFLIILGIVIVLIVAGVLYQKNSVVKYSPTAATPADQKEVSNLVAAVGKLIVLPGEETPTVATVSDPEKLKDQPFFAQAKVGDKVLLYATARKAYLYDPVANKILEVAPINLGTESTVKSP